jgi:hypothetical protein
MSGVIFYFAIIKPVGYKLKKVFKLVEKLLMNLVSLQRFLKSQSVNFIFY